MACYGEKVIDDQMTLLQKGFFTSVEKHFSHQVATDVKCHDVVCLHLFTSGRN